MELLYDPRAFGPTGRKNDPYVYEPYPLPVDFTERLVDAAKKDKPSIEDIPLGKLLEFNGTERDDIMSVIEDWLFDTSLRQLRDKYPILETYIKEMLL